MTTVSLSFRRAANAGATDQIPIMLLAITPPGETDVLLLSSDPTERLSDEPLMYGTRSGGKTYPFVIMSAVLPDDQADSPPQTTLVFENVDRQMASAIRASIEPATVTLSVVMSGSLDDVELTFTGLRGVAGTFDADKISYTISREPFTSEPMPAGRMTQARFPGLWP